MFRQTVNSTIPLCLLLGLALLAAVAQASSLTTVKLQNRPAEEVIPVIEPMLGAGEAVSGRGFTLFLRASPATLAQVREMIGVLDVAAKSLQISVLQGSARDLEKLGIDGGVRIERGDASVGVGSRRADGGAAGGSITYGTRGGSASLSGTSTRLRLADSPLHQVRVTEGSAAYIETGARIPIFSGSHWIAPDAVAGGIEYEDVVTGFYVLPRVHGDSVTLEVSPFRNALRGGDIARQSASSTLSGRIGEWLFVGGVSEQRRRSQSGIGSYNSTQSRNSDGIWIRADLLR